MTEKIIQSHGMQLIILGIALFVITAVLFIVFLSGEKKRKNKRTDDHAEKPLSVSLTNGSMQAMSDSETDDDGTALMRDGGEIAMMATNDLSNREDDGTVLMSVSAANNSAADNDDGTVLMENVNCEDVDDRTVLMNDAIDVVQASENGGTPTTDEDGTVLMSAQSTDMVEDVNTVLMR